MQPYHNLVLTGFMGTGKTTVGRELALKLGMEFVDTDELIESRHGSIATIFEEQGEAAFREMERAIAVELGQRRGLVIATGGRMIIDPVGFTELSRHGRVFCLVATPDEIHRRVTDDPLRPDRPLLKVDDPRERIIELMAERQDDYGRFPQLITDNRDPGAIADEVAELWRGDVN
ncbi:MAG TPA: shikimate kinase [Acidimicrobiia bacterium]|nr:shikimate kinase [Acidimicrobiia bacterium]